MKVSDVVGPTVALSGSRGETQGPCEVWTEQAHCCLAALPTWDRPGPHLMAGSGRHSEASPRPSAVSGRAWGAPRIGRQSKAAHGQLGPGELCRGPPGPAVDTCGGGGGCSQFTAGLGMTIRSHLY